MSDEITTTDRLTPVFLFNVINENYMFTIEDWYELEARGERVPKYWQGPPMLDVEGNYFVEHYKWDDGIYEDYISLGCEEPIPPLLKRTNDLLSEVEQLNVSIKLEALSPVLRVIASGWETSIYRTKRWSRLRKRPRHWGFPGNPVPSIHPKWIEKQALWMPED